MKIWKLVSGIISIVLSIPMLIFSCALGFAYSLGAQGYEPTNVAAGLTAALFILAAGITSAATSFKAHGNLALLILNAIAALLCFVYFSFYLLFFGLWAAVCAILAIIMLIYPPKIEPKKPVNEVNTFFMIDDSMENLIPCGYQISVKMTKTIESGQIGVFEYNGETLIRQIVYNDEYAILEPVNKTFPKIKIEANNIHNLKTLGVVIETRKKLDFEK